MKKAVIFVYRTVENIFFSLFFVNKEYRFMGLKNYITYFFFQRILMINFSVPWPVHWASIVTGHKKIKFKDEKTPLGYSPGSYIQASCGIEVGSNVIHAAGIKIITSNHDLCDFNIHVESKPVVIGDNCWLGANVILLPGVILANHTIVAAGSVVTKSFLEEDCIIAGNPARFIKKVDPYNGKHYFLDNKVVKNNSIVEVS